MKSKITFLMSMAFCFTSTLYALSNHNQMRLNRISNLKNLKPAERAQVLDALIDFSASAGQMYPKAKYKSVFFKKVFNQVIPSAYSDHEELLTELRKKERLIEELKSSSNNIENINYLEKVRSQIEKIKLYISNQYSPVEIEKEVNKLALISPDIDKCLDGMCSKDMQVTTDKVKEYEGFQEQLKLNDFVTRTNRQLKLLANKKTNSRTGIGARAGYSTERKGLSYAARSGSSKALERASARSKASNNRNQDSRGADKKSGSIMIDRDAVSARVGLSDDNKNEHNSPYGVSAGVSIGRDNNRSNSSDAREAAGNTRERITRDKENQSIKINPATQAGSYLSKNGNKTPSSSDADKAGAGLDNDKSKSGSPYGAKAGASFGKSSKGTPARSGVRAGAYLSKNGYKTPSSSDADKAGAGLDNDKSKSGSPYGAKAGASFGKSSKGTPARSGVRAGAYLSKNGYKTPSSSDADKAGAGLDDNTSTRGRARLNNASRSSSNSPHRTRSNASSENKPGKSNEVTIKEVDELKSMPLWKNAVVDTKNQTVKTTVTDSKGKTNEYVFDTKDNSVTINGKKTNSGFPVHMAGPAQAKKLLQFENEKKEPSKKIRPKPPVRNYNCMFATWPSRGNTTNDKDGNITKINYCYNPIGTPLYKDWMSKAKKNNSECKESGMYLCNPAFFGLKNPICVKYQTIDNLSQRCADTYENLDLKDTKIGDSEDDFRLMRQADEIIDNDELGQQFKETLKAAVLFCDKDREMAAKNASNHTPFCKILYKRLGLDWEKTKDKDFSIYEQHLFDKIKIECSNKNRDAQAYKDLQSIFDGVKESTMNDITKKEALKALNSPDQGISIYIVNISSTEYTFKAVNASRRFSPNSKFDIYLNNAKESFRELKFDPYEKEFSIKKDQLPKDGIVFIKSMDKYGSKEFGGKTRQSNSIQIDDGLNENAGEVDEDEPEITDDDLQPTNEKIDDEKSDGEKSDDEKSDDEKSDDEKSDDEKSDDEKSDDEKSDDEGSDGEKSDGEGSDGEKSDGEGSDGEKPDGEKSDGEGSDGEKSDGEGSDGEKSDGEGSDGEGSDGEGSDGEGSDGEGSDGEGSDGEGSDGEGSDGEGSDGEGSDGEGSDGDPLKTGEEGLEDLEDLLNENYEPVNENTPGPYQNQGAPPPQNKMIIRGGLFI